MVFDKNRPLGSTPISQGDNLHRENYAALETALDAEHDFTTGGTQTGQHHFPVDTLAAVSALGTSSVDGRLLFADNVIASARVGYVVDATALYPIVPPDPWVKRDATQNWTVGQYGTRTAVTPAGGPPLEFAWVLTDANFFTATLTGNTIIKPPTDALTTARMGSWTIQLLQDGSGGHTVTFDTAAFLPANGAQPAVDPAANSYTLIHITRLAKTAPNLVYTVQRCA